MSSQSKVQYSLGKVPFSWENKPGVSKATQPPHPYRELPPPPCPCGEAPPKLSLQDFHLPLPPCTFQPLSRSSSTKAFRKHEDPFLVAFQECTKPPEGKAKDKTTSSNKYRFRSELGSWFGFGLSCKQSSSVRDDSLSARISSSIVRQQEQVLAPLIAHSFPHLLPNCICAEMANNPQSSAAQPFRPPPVASLGPQSFGSSPSLQYRPVVPTQQGQQFIQSASQQFQPVGQGIPSSNVGMPASQSQQLQFSQPMQPYPLRPSQPGHATPSSQALPMQYMQTRPITSVPSQSQQPALPFNNQMPGLAGGGMPYSSSYMFAPPSYAQPQNNVSSSSQFQPMSQVQAHVTATGQPWMSSGNQGAAVPTPVQQSGQQPSSTTFTDSAVNVPSQTQQSSSDWQEHTSGDGRRYYFNRRTKQSSWEKPLELMTPMERADASTVWKEYTSSDGKKYYYNKVTRESKWTIPEELKAQRELPGNTFRNEFDFSCPSCCCSAETPMGSSSVGPSTSSALPGMVSSPVAVIPVSSFSNPSPLAPTGSSVASGAQSSITGSVGIQPPVVTVTPLAASVSGSTGVPPTLVNTNTKSVSTYENVTSQEIGSADDGAFTQDIEEAKRGMAVAGKVNVTPSEEKTVDEEPLVYANKQEAKNAFKALLESANVHSDWTWEQTMREIINDKRYGALKTLGERKQAFNEYLGQRKKLENEERRMRQKKAREEFSKMLEESKELTSATRWRTSRDREDLYESYIVELERKEKEKAAEEHKQNIAEYRKFLESCDFIKVSLVKGMCEQPVAESSRSLRDDERCLRLEKLDRLLIFQDYIRDLEKEEEEQKKIQKEQLRRVERKNRDEFRKLMEEHVADGILTAKTHWRDYCMKVKDLSSYEAVASNTSGSTPKELFEDVAEELEKQYHEDKARIKDAMKLGKVTLASTLTFEEFKVAILEDIGFPSISDINFKLVYEELLERAKEKEEKEAKKRHRLGDDFNKLLHTFKEITASSNWEDCKHLFEETQEYRSIGEENFSREVFEEYVTNLQEKAKEEERKREEEKAKKEREREEKEKRKDKERKEKEKEREREKEKGKERSKKDETDSENVDVTDSHGHKEDKKREKDKDRKHRKRHQSSMDEVGSDKEEKEESKKRRHSSDRKRSRKHTPESDSESRHRRHKREHQDGSRRNVGYGELEDGEVGEDGEIQ
ncbi:pre-mRNA-processing protein 40A isoform X1 [Prunus yedoensis var. nudiflora]|uniref:Pre-mRNA-processing protein 40A isoform X1 n=1 Tax=Prunus yedoensis var. nudiflora TaxID=2094558 RepID=A0A314XP93_PRUYE|nr:pre-mRNA-processing protein 40A isoform X1 [Prunus yedoensis var. nudiflora]